MKPNKEKPKGRKQPAKDRRRPERSKRSSPAGARKAGAGRKDHEPAVRPAPPGGLSWEELGVLRETFLARISAPEHAMTLRAMARLFYLLVLEGAGHFPNQREAQVRVMLRAAALDIKGVASYLADRDHHDRDPHESREELGLHVIADRAADSRPPDPPRLTC